MVKKTDMRISDTSKKKVKCASYNLLHSWNTDTENNNAPTKMCSICTNTEFCHTATLMHQKNNMLLTGV